MKKIVYENLVRWNGSTNYDQARDLGSPPTARIVDTYWYKTTVYYCPLCGRDDTYKERVYDEEKPKEWEKRFTFKEVWDYCDI